MNHRIKKRAATVVIAVLLIFNSLIGMDVTYAASTGYSTLLAGWYPDDSYQITIANECATSEDNVFGIVQTLYFHSVEVNGESYWARPDNEPVSATYTSDGKIASAKFNILYGFDDIYKTITINFSYADGERDILDILANEGKCYIHHGKPAAEVDELVDAPVVRELQKKDVEFFIAHGGGGSPYCYIQTLMVKHNGIAYGMLEIYDLMDLCVKVEDAWTEKQIEDAVFAEVQALYPFTPASDLKIVKSSDLKDSQYYDDYFDLDIDEFYEYLTENSLEIVNPYNMYWKFDNGVWESPQICFFAVREKDILDSVFESLYPGNEITVMVTSAYGRKYRKPTREFYMAVEKSANVGSSVVKFEVEDATLTAFYFDNLLRTTKLRGSIVCPAYDSSFRKPITVNIEYVNADETIQNILTNDSYVKFVEDSLTDDILNKYIEAPVVTDLIDNGASFLIGRGGGGHNFNTMNYLVVCDGVVYEEIEVYEMFSGLVNVKDGLSDIEKENVILQDTEKVFSPEYFPFRKLEKTDSFKEEFEYINVDPQVLIDYLTEKGADVSEKYMLYLKREASDDWFSSGYVSVPLIERPDIFEYQIINDTVKITGHKVELEGEIVVPDTIEGYPVTSIGGLAFQGCDDITSVKLPDTVVEIGGTAFGGCSKIESIILPNNLKTVGNYAFGGCSGLTKIVIPDSVTYIGRGAFGGCSSLEELTVPFIGEEPTTPSYGGLDYTDMKTTMINIGWWFSVGALSEFDEKIPSTLKKVVITKQDRIRDYALLGCSHLEEVVFPDNIKSIGASAFRYCGALKKINIPKSVSTIGRRAFSQCGNLAEVTFSADSALTSIGDEAFSGCFESINLPDSLLTIGANAFSACNRLKEVEIPDSVTSIGSSAFLCSNLETITLPRIYNGKLQYICGKVTGITSSDVEVTKSLKKVILTGVEDIPAGAFSKCRYIEEIVLAEGTKVIGGSAFYGCGNLASIELPESLETIDNYAFNDCYSLDSFTIPKDVEKIGSGILTGCTKIKTVSVPFLGASKEDLTTSSRIGYLFGCMNSAIPSSLSEVEITNADAIANSAFSEAKYIKKITINDEVNSIGFRAFYVCDRLNELIMPWPDSGDTLMNLFGANFSSTTDGLSIPNLLNEITITSATSLPDYAFAGFSSLRNITLCEGIESIGSNAFRGCVNLTDVNIPDETTSIGDYAFKGCRNLNTITIGKAVDTIGEDIFNSCSGLKKVYIYPRTCIREYCDGNELPWEYVDGCELAVEGDFPKEYLEGFDELDVDLITLKVCYDDIFDTITVENEMIEGFSNGTVGDKELLFTYKGLTTTCVVTIVAKNFEFINVTSLPDKMEYIEGQNFDPTGMVVTAYYNNATTDDVDEYVIGGYDATIGEKTITITYNGKTCSFVVMVVPKRLESIELISEPKKMIYRRGESLSIDGAMLKGVFDNDTTEEVEVSAAMVSGFDSSMPGECEVTVTWFDKIVKFIVNIIDYLTADFNDDEMVTDADAIYLLYHTFFPEDYPLNQDGDINGDGMVTDADAIYVLYHTFFPEDYPLA